MMKNIKKISKYLHDYRFNSIFFKNMMRLLLLAVIPLIFMALISYYSYDNIQQQAVRADSDRMIGDYHGEWGRILGEAKAELGYIAFSESVELFMYDTSDLKQLNYSVIGINDMMTIPIISKNYVDSIYIYSQKNNLIISKEGTANYKNARGKLYVDMYRADTEKRNVLLVEDDYKGKPEQYVVIYQEVKYGPESQGLAIMALSVKKLAEELNTSEDVTFLLTSGDQIIFSDNEDDIGTSIMANTYYELVQHDGNELYDDVSISSRSLDEFGLEVFLFYKTGDYFNQLKGIRNIMCLLIVICFVFMSAVAFVISMHMYRPIGEILSSIKRNQNVLVGDKTFLEKDEIDYILKAISQSAIKKQNVDEELKMRIHLLKKAQSVALQSQINPHFLNNTLDTINWISISHLGVRNEISEMTNALSKMLRMALENTDMIIPIEAEIEHCQNYLFIQKRRYEDQFDISWNIPEEVYGCGTIRIVMQPIVENAIYHGVKPLTGGGQIDISARVRDGTVEIDVMDNGLGMSEKELSCLRQSMTEDMIHESRHIGLTNVNQRLQLYFGKEYGLTVESAEGVGTLVRIKMPKITSHSGV